MNAYALPLESIAGFAALLREHGLKVGIAEQQAMVRATVLVPIERSASLDGIWRAIACHDARDWKRWPELFARYWHPERASGSTRVSGQTRPRRDLRQLVQGLHNSLSAGPSQSAASDAALGARPSFGDEGALSRAQGGASLTEALHDRSFSQWLPQELGQLDALAEQITRRLRKRLTRRWQDHAVGRRLDLRRTLRASLRTGGVPLHPVWRRPRRATVRLFVLVDVSRSMETHAQLFLRIARAFVTAMRARVFVFHTRLAEVTALLQSDSAAVQEKVNAVTAGFGGGTRIATSVADFRGIHVRAQLGREARVWLLSDGYDADPPEELARELARVRKRGARIDWFHPSERVPASEAVAIVNAGIGLVDRYFRLNCLADLAAVADHLR